MANGRPCLMTISFVLGYNEAKRIHHKPHCVEDGSFEVYGIINSIYGICTISKGENMDRIKIIALLLALLLLVGCATPAATAPIISSVEESTDATQSNDPTITPVPTPNPNFNAAQTPVGMIIANESDLFMRCAQHGFLRTAENLGYPAKLYTAAADELAVQKVDEAIADKVKGLLIWADSAQMTQVIEKAEQAGIIVVVPYSEVEGTSAKAVLATEVVDYSTEAARIMCEEIIKTKNSGSIIITGSEFEPQIAEAFTAAVAKNYPQYLVENFQTLADHSVVDESGLPVDNLSIITQFIQSRADIVGVLALKAGTAKAWSEVSKTVEAQLKAATPSPSTQSTPEGTNNNERRPVIIALDYYKENLELVKDGSIYALIARPYYDSAAQSMAVLDRLLRNIATQTQVRINAPIIRKNGIDKYECIVTETMSWFDMKG